ncbi:extracellular guanyl-specific ribonuclease fl2 [Fusarium sporotrichioides]|uniref:Extracellular guanyl-specific ribonuclease fl2 n=1 Tax=Fusarium sporotrichioides TaxID=5514 RepID=A0A395SHN7_FUSSP|nr:extracellular guanyl-specific ribonuclease fl2 [Fusarium sporotrichioides]
MALTFSALAEHNQQMAYMSMSPPTSPHTDDDNSSECSYYSLADLQNDRWYRNIPASQIREQAKEVPDLPAHTTSSYPRKFHNSEQLGLKSRGPWREYPFCLNKRYSHGSPGPVRIIINSANSEDVDVIYHPTQDNRKVCLAKYRAKGYSKGACLKPSPHNPLPANNTFGIPEGRIYQWHGVCQGLGAYYQPVQQIAAPVTPAMQVAMFSQGYPGCAPAMPTWEQYDAGLDILLATIQFPTT